MSSGSSEVLKKGAVIIAGAATCVALPHVGLWALGFSSPGIVAGSAATGWMSSGYLTGVLATCQSVGAAGFATSTYAALGGTGAYVGHRIRGMFG